MPHSAVCGCSLVVSQSNFNQITKLLGMVDVSVTGTPLLQTREWRVPGFGITRVIGYSNNLKIAII